MKTIILYFSTDGQTKSIAEQIAQDLHYEVSLFSLKDNEVTPEQLADADQIIIGASVRYGRFDPILTTFIQQHQTVLNHKKTAFFSVNLVARKINKRSIETNVYTRKLLESIEWKPTFVEIFAGRLLYSKYHWFERIIIQFIMRITGGETDTSKDIEYTDWQQVKVFSDKLNLVSDNLK
ncbi:menaquinone-dependent protoporphyrinogen IX dehydrogenase [Pasteurella skyensis]|uniref:Protoporphyrinogen IX dehydrogenase [quinone] n=1 Tax=Phocoenobacter skyensis TaxID=97481 RepID=A0AAJ6NBH8_9PAST|nr:menaquinone-dependent protoporphyrinogen IX dehydrogenase [Pasteurella skyensis]MDP8163444.1 menaquinone-dependent protoporphyrinogen IX dehydrogenase [Pasteurella skyensis]MDP8173735.1 menaquinone-dependent protoporphyrinogen IX dehydrogenase [Pasteurella skyensis]MDP8177797.1 menaquinone-dependent protoporphyrinogen IX dehydrogenase [Pasteurella skyensis]MDP8179893.1 menaquinone-dependent protoporphyrinogen IX dehydrogenase [Pasteurella skyensis]MDP8184007.1 menaquinone-dependent protopor